MMQDNDVTRMSAPTELAVVGLGYVGLPLAKQATACGIGVVGFDLDERVTARLNAGTSHVDDLSDDDVSEMLGTGFIATSDPAVLGAVEAIVICVPTPLDDSGSPDLAAVIGASTTIASELSAGQLVVLESTTYPGTTEDVVRPILERGGLIAGTDFHLAYSPERIDPGNPVYGVHNTPKVVGGVNEKSTAVAGEFYGRFIETIVPVGGTREAEMAKLLENTYRHVNIALVNEMAIFCHDLGVDLWESIGAASTKPFGFQAFYPGPGVGGHCIPIDPNYLSYKVRTLGYPFRFVELAQEISARMPNYVVNRIVRNLNTVEKSVRGARIVLLGVTYKKNIADERESPAQPLARHLIELGADLRFHDPYVTEWEIDGALVPRVDDHLVEVEAADLTVLLQAHVAYDGDELVSRAARVFDTRGCLTGANVERL
jgi:UDP-N-acetyl-D-glucosamine dehydrogenase